MHEFTLALRLGRASIRRMLISGLMLVTSWMLPSTSMAQQPCTYNTCNPWGATRFVAVGRTALSACEKHIPLWIAGDGINVNTYGGYPTASVCGGDSNCCFTWPAGQLNYTWLCKSCKPEITDDLTCQTANPVQPGIGSKRFQETDYVSTEGHPLNVVRHYKSVWTDGAAAAGLTPIAPWEGGWRHNYQATLTLREDGSLRAFRPDGSMLRFSPSPTTANTWIGIIHRDTITALVDAAGVHSGYTYAAFADDSIETYDIGGHLLSIKTRNGWLTTLIYSDATTPLTEAPRTGLLIGVRNQFGRQIRFTYDSLGRVAELLPPGAISGQPAGSTASPIRYVYNESASLGSATPVQSQLTSIVWPDGTTKRYHYEDAQWPQAVTGITDETGIRYSSYTYDVEGRVARSELANGVGRLDFTYGSDTNGNATTVITDYATGSASSRTYTFIDIDGSRYPQMVTAPCLTCGSTAQLTQYDTAGKKSREVTHDGAVTFYSHNAKGQETERATFPASYQNAATRPALHLSTNTTSTKWHATWNLPTQTAQPGLITSYTYNARGLTGLSTVATTDATGAAKFSAVKSGPIRATGYGYNANSLNTSVVERTDGVETQRWTLAYNASGDLTRITDVTGAQSATITQYTADGRVLRGATDQGVPIAITYSARGVITQITRDIRTVRFTYNAVGTLIQVRTPDNQVIDYVVDASQALVDIQLNGASVSAQMLALGEYPDSALKGQIESAKQVLIQSVEGLLRSAHAQVVVAGGVHRPTGPVFDPRTDMLVSPISEPDKAVRAIQELIARACRCDPNQGFAAPKFTAVTFAHVFYGGHVTPMFSDKSTFAPTEKVGQSLVDEVVSRAMSKTTKGTRDVYNVDMRRIVGMRYDGASASSYKHVPTQWITMIVERNNCSSTWRANEVVTLYPDMERR